MHSSFLHITKSGFTGTDIPEQIPKTNFHESKDKKKNSAFCDLLFNTYGLGSNFSSGSSVISRESLKLKPADSQQSQTGEKGQTLNKANLAEIFHPLKKTIPFEQMKIETKTSEKKPKGNLDKSHTSQSHQNAEKKDTTTKALVSKNNQEQTNRHSKATQTEPIAKDLNTKTSLSSSLMTTKHSITPDNDKLNLVPNHNNFSVSKDKQKSLDNSSNRRVIDSSRLTVTSKEPHSAIKGANLTAETKGQHEFMINPDRYTKSKHSTPSDGLQPVFSTLKNTSDAAFVQPPLTSPQGTSTWDNFLHFMEKVMQGARIIHHSEGLSELRVRMASDTLGQVTIQLSVTENQVDVKFALDSSQAKQILQEHQSELIQILKEQGADFVNIDVSTSFSQDGYQNQPSGEANDRQGNPSFFTRHDLEISEDSISRIDSQVNLDSHPTHMYDFDGISSMVWVA